MKKLLITISLFLSLNSFASYGTDPDANINGSIFQYNNVIFYYHGSFDGYFKNKRAKITGYGLNGTLKDLKAAKKFYESYGNEVVVQKTIHVSKDYYYLFVLVIKNIDI